MIGRVFRIVRVPITLLILLGVLLYGANWGFKNVFAEIPPAPPPSCIQQKVPKGQLKADQVTVRVYNGGDKHGLAGDIGRTMRGKGFKVSITTNTKERIKGTVIVGSGAKNPEVLLVHSFFKKATIRVDGRVDGSVDVLVGSTYAGFNKKAKNVINVGEKAVCLPASSTASPTVANG